MIVISTLKKILKKHTTFRFFKFSCVGILNTVIDALIFYLACDVLGIYEIISNVFAYLISSLNSYLLNSKFVYKQEHYSWGKYSKFILANTSVLVISSVFLMIFSRYFTLKTIAKLISIPITVVLNFCLQSFVVFKDKDKSE